MSKINNYKPPSSITNDPEKLATQALQDRFKVGTNNNVFERHPGHTPGSHWDASKAVGSNSATKISETASKEAAKLVDDAGKKAITFSQRAASLVEKIGNLFKKFRLGSALKKLVTKFPKLAKFLGGGVGVYFYVLDTSELSASTPPVWRTRFNDQSWICKRSSDPLVQLGAMRKMCAILYKVQSKVDMDFRKAVCGGRQVYQEDAAKRNELVRTFQAVFLDYRIAAGDAGHILQQVCSAARLILSEAQTAYGWNKPMVSRFAEFNQYFSTFEKTAQQYISSGAELAADRASVTAELQAAVC